VDMGMNLEFLVPGMQHAEEADLSPEMPGLPWSVGRFVNQMIADRLGCQNCRSPDGHFLAVNDEGDRIVSICSLDSRHWD
jgi:hypothetical protein